MPLTWPGSAPTCSGRGTIHGWMARPCRPSAARAGTASPWPSCGTWKPVGPGRNEPIGPRGLRSGTMNPALESVATRIRNLGTSGGFA
ncbi:hypothetical protein ACFFX0_14715 [Citricoccus parietis]|uniref:Uncharacterized protein n=1 Tax=Citricoccus parietis TaxID=592307 RepID=A0ABV5G0D1_9MICC